jgi:hypothetical protein
MISHNPNIRQEINGNALKVKHVANFVSFSTFSFSHTDMLVANGQRAPCLEPPFHQARVTIEISYNLIQSRSQQFSIQMPDFPIRLLHLILQNEVVIIPIPANTASFFTTISSLIKTLLEKHT